MEWTATAKPEILKGEVRKIVEYYLDGTPLEGFDKSITITNMFNIPTDVITRVTLATNG